MDRVEDVVQWFHAVYGRLLEWAISERDAGSYIPTIGIFAALRTEARRRSGPAGSRSPTAASC